MRLILPTVGNPKDWYARCEWQQEEKTLSIVCESSAGSWGIAKEMSCHYYDLIVQA